MAKPKAQPNLLAKLDTAKRTPLGAGLSSIGEGALAYIAASWAIDSGSLWAYLFAIIFTIGSIKNLVQAVQALRANRK